jgi:hypothetical protein
LGRPQHLAEAFHHLMLRLVRRIEPLGQRLVRGADAARLVHRHLLADRQVHRQVQERVALAALGRVVTGEGLVAGVQGVVVFGMLLHPVDRHGFERREDFSLAMLAPGAAEKLANFVAGGIEHDPAIVPAWPPARCRPRAAPTLQWPPPFPKTAIHRRIP